MSTVIWRLDRSKSSAILTRLCVPFNAGNKIMPIHDWTRVPSGLFHHFHQDWSIEIARCLNRGLLPPGVSALVEQRAGAREPDVLAIESWSGLSNRRGGLAGDIEGGVVTNEAPTARIVYRSTEEIYAA